MEQVEIRKLMKRFAPKYQWAYYQSKDRLSVCRLLAQQRKPKLGRMRPAG